MTMDLDRLSDEELMRLVRLKPKFGTTNTESALIQTEFR
jgi:hypothetical protein